LSSQVIIGTSLFGDELKEKLETELKFLDDQETLIDFEELEEPPWVYYGLRLSRKKQKGERKFASRFAVAKAIAELFINQLEAEYIKEYIEDIYYYCSPQDRFEIVSLTLETLDKLKIIRRNRILQSVFDYLADNQLLNIEGFARFRLQGYWAQLRRIVKRTGEEFLAAKDYLEFVRLLRCFIELQETKIDEAHIFISPEGTFFICDKKGHVIKREHIRTPSFSAIDGEFNYKEYLLSMLIVLVPETIIFHVSDGIWECDPIRTIQQVFEDRVTRCPGCDRCQHLYSSKKKQ
jgi:putative sporulation protein YtxC